MSAKCPLFHSDLGAKSNQRKSHPSITACGYLALLNKISGCGTRAFSTQTVLAASHLPLKPKARQGGI
jgi:hypothetical protein